MLYTSYYRKTWTATPAVGKPKNWLEDFLPEQIPNARIMSYGYDSTVQFSKSVAGIGFYLLMYPRFYIFIKVFLRDIVITSLKARAHY